LTEVRDPPVNVVLNVKIHRGPLWANSRHACLFNISSEENDHHRRCAPTLLELWHVPVLLDGGTALCGRPRVPALRRSFHPDDLLPELKAAGVDYTITVEAADGKAENEALLANARVHAWIAGVDHIGKPPIAARGWEPWASLLARAVREPKRFQNAQRNYERYLALARAEAQLGNTVGGELLPVRRISFQIDVRGLRTGVRDFAAMAACRWQPSVLRRLTWSLSPVLLVIDRLGAMPLFLGAAVVLPTLATWFAHELRRRGRGK
jgi:hypothetical protein